MGFWGTWFGAKRPSPVNVTDGRFWGDEEWAGLRGEGTEANTAEQAARVSAVNFCTSILAETVGSLGLDFIDTDNNSVDFPLARVLRYEPNPLQTGSEFWAAMTFTAVLRGHAFAEPVVTSEGIELWALDPRRTTVDWGERSFSVNHVTDRGSRRMLPQQLFWFAGLADGGLQPMVPWKMARGSIDFQLALEVGARQFFRNNKQIAGVLSTDTKLTEESVPRIKEGVDRWKRGGIPVLEQGLKYTPSVSNNSDSQLMELIKQRTLELARYWQIPRSMAGEDAGPASSQEQEALNFVKYAIRPRARRIEQAITTRLLPPDIQARGVCARFNMDGLLRGDSATQWRNAVLARTASVMSVNQIATRFFGLPRIPEAWADDPQLPLNSNRAADTMTGGQTAPQDRTETENA